MPPPASGPAGGGGFNRAGSDHFRKYGEPGTGELAHHRASIGPEVITSGNVSLPGPLPPEFIASIGPEVITSGNGACGIWDARCPLRFNRAGSDHFRKSFGRVRVAPNVICFNRAGSDHFRKCSRVTRWPAIARSLQ